MIRCNSEADRIVWMEEDLGTGGVISPLVPEIALVCAHAHSRALPSVGVRVPAPAHALNGFVPGIFSWEGWL